MQVRAIRLDDAEPIKRCLETYHAMPTAEQLEAARGDPKKERELGTPENILTQLNYIGERITGVSFKPFYDI